MELIHEYLSVNLFFSAAKKRQQQKLLKQPKIPYELNFVPNVVYQGYRPRDSIQLHFKIGQKAGFNEDSEFYDVLIPKKLKQKEIESQLNRQTPRSPISNTIEIEEAIKN